MDLDVRVRWSGEQPTPDPCNMFVVQLNPADEVVLNFGYVVAPALIGTKEDRQEQVEQIMRQGLEVECVARVVLTLKTARELVEVLGNQVLGDQELSDNVATEGHDT